MKRFKPIPTFLPEGLVKFRKRGWRQSSTRRTKFRRIIMIVTKRNGG